MLLFIKVIFILSDNNKKPKINIFKSWLFGEAILFIIKLIDFFICPASSSVLRKSLNLFTTWQKLLAGTPVNIVFLFDEILSAFCFRMTAEAFRCSDSH